jgi:hypothetical protein
VGCDFDILTFCITRSGVCLVISAEALQADRDVVSAAVQQNGLALHFASPRLRRDKAGIWSIALLCFSHLLMWFVQYCSMFVCILYVSRREECKCVVQ